MITDSIDIAFEPLEPDRVYANCLKTCAMLGVEPVLAKSAARFCERRAHRPQTKFEARGLKLGRGVWDAVFHRPAEPEAPQPGGTDQCIR